MNLPVKTKRKRRRAVKFKGKKKTVKMLKHHLPPNLLSKEKTRLKTRRWMGK